MRSDPREFELVTPGSLSAVLDLLAREPADWTPFAGGTDLMVLYGAGKLAGRRFVSVWELPELRRIETTPEELRIGAACTYSDIRRNETIQSEFPLLTAAASWTGGIANQNRGTLGGNIVNASPAADSLPALLAYEAAVVLVSNRGARTVPYTDFHSGYKTHALKSDELIQTIVLSRRYANYFAYGRKAGARNAQAISKVCIAGLAKLEGKVITDIRIGMGSVAPVPLRLRDTETLVLGKPVTPSTISEAKRSVARQIQPIDDIRSTAAYRTAVAENHVAEFLEKLQEQTGVA